MQCRKVFFIFGILFFIIVSLGWMAMLVNSNEFSIRHSTNAKIEKIILNDEEYIAISCHIYNNDTSLSILEFNNDQNFLNIYSIVKFNPLDSYDFFTSPIFLIPVSKFKEGKTDIIIEDKILFKILCKDNKLEIL